MSSGKALWQIIRHNSCTTLGKYRERDCVQRSLQARGVNSRTLPSYKDSLAHSAVILRSVAASSGQFQFAIPEEQGSLAASNGCDVTDQLISDLTCIASQYESSATHIKVNGRPVVYFLDVDAYL